jgi:hypothetical protein
MGNHQCSRPDLVFLRDPRRLVKGTGMLRFIQEGSASERIRHLPSSAYLQHRSLGNVNESIVQIESWSRKSRAITS